MSNPNPLGGTGLLGAPKEGFFSALLRRLAEEQEQKHASPQPLTGPQYEAAQGVARMTGRPVSLPANRARTPSRAPNPQSVLDRRGVLPQQRSAGWDPIHARQTFEAVYPVGYGDKQPTSLKEAEAWSQGGPDAVPGTQSRAARMLRVNTGNARANPPRILASTGIAPQAVDLENAWRMYLGLPQQGHSFAVSQYRPSKSSDQHGIYYAMPGFWDRYLNTYTGPEEGFLHTPAEVIRNLVETGGDHVTTNTANHARKPGEPVIALDETEGQVMDHFKIGTGQDQRGPYLSYYDRWDLAPRNPVARAAANYNGRPFELYDRLYYDPRTYEPLPGQ